MSGRCQADERECRETPCVAVGHLSGGRPAGIGTGRRSSLRRRSSPASTAFAGRELGALATPPADAASHHDPPRYGHLAALFRPYCASREKLWEVEESTVLPLLTPHTSAGERQSKCARPYRGRRKSLSSTHLRRAGPHGVGYPGGQAPRRQACRIHIGSLDHHPLSCLIVPKAAVLVAVSSRMACAQRRGRLARLEWRRLDSACA